MTMINDFVVEPSRQYVTSKVERPSRYTRHYRETIADIFVNEKADCLSRGASIEAATENAFLACRVYAKENNVYMPLESLRGILASQRVKYGVPRYTKPIVSLNKITHKAFNLDRSLFAFLRNNYGFYELSYEKIIETIIMVAEFGAYDKQMNELADFADNLKEVKRTCRFTI